MAFIFKDSTEQIRRSPYYKWLKRQVVLNIGQPGLKKNYLKSQGYRNEPDENKERDQITPEQFETLLVIEQTYHDDYLRRGCERFSNQRLSESDREFTKQIQYKRSKTPPFYS